MESNPQIHPLSLGNVNRVHNLIRILAKRLLKSHKSPMPDEEISKIVDYLTEKLYSHQYFIGRKEAKQDLGIETVVSADDQISDLMTQLYEEYKKEMQFEKPWNPQTELGANQSQNRVDYKIAVVESFQLSNFYQLSLEFKRAQTQGTQQTPTGPIQVPQEQIVWRPVEQGWKEV